MRLRPLRNMLPYIVSGAVQALLIGGLASWGYRESRWDIALESGRSSMLSVAIAAAEPVEDVERLETQELEITFEDAIEPASLPLDQRPVVEVAPDPLPVTAPEPPRQPIAIQPPPPPLPKNLAQPLPRAESPTPATANAPAEEGAVVEAPARRLPTNGSPVYPLDARAAAIEGRVVLRAHIAADGAVERVTIETSSGNESLDAAALAAVQRWRFAPATRNGQPTASDVLVPVRFTIRR